jgi:hypothetical protein
MRAAAIGRAAAMAVLLGSAVARGEAVRGQINGWGTNWMATNAAFTGDTRWMATVTCTQTWTNAGFKIDLRGDWTTNWGTGTMSTNAVINSTIGQGHKNTATGSDGGNLTYAGQTNGMRFTFRMDGDHTWLYRPYVIMATTNDPVGVTNVTATSASAGTNAVAVTSQLSAAPSGERVYVRYTTNSFSTWSALATGAVSGTTATMMIPGQPSGRTVKYYVLTSTMPTNLLVANYDLCTLRGNTSGGTNFTYLVGEAAPVFGNCWHFPTNAEPAGATMRNPTNPAPTLTTYVYVGNYYEAGVGGADMTGGWVFYKKSTDGAWSSNALAWDSTVGLNKYWIGAIPSNAVAAGETLQYYLQVNYTNGGADVTYLGTTNQLGAEKYAQATNAAAHPFAVASAEVPPVFGNCWHFPTNTIPWAEDSMRVPTNPTPAKDTWIYVGNYQGDADMTGGAVVWRAGAGNWATNGLGYVTNSGSDNYWSSKIPSNGVMLGETLQYYIRVDYANGGADTTYLGTTTQADNVKYAAATNAAAHSFAAVGTADLGNAWHVPANAEPVGAYMRNPRHPYATNTVTIYNGNQFAGSGTTGNQSGGTLYYRLQGAGGWSSAALAFDSESGNNKYWEATIPSGTFDKLQTVEYVLAVAYTDRDPTYLGTTNQTTTAKYAVLASAQANPYIFTYGGVPGTEPGYVWHGGNVVRSAGDAVQIWTKIGYEATNGVRWADHAEVRYRITTNGASKRTMQGVSRLSPAKKVVAADLILTNAMDFSHTETDSSENGNAMWWVATIQAAGLTNLEALVQYQVAAWKSTTNGGNDVVRLAEYQSDGVSGEIFEYRMYGGGAGALTVNGQNADYTTTKFFIDEARGETATITARYTPPAGATSIEIFSNVGRRDLVDTDWNSDGVPDGIKPPDGNLIATNDTTAYFAAFPMTWNGSAYEWTANVGKCGAYRLTARYHATGQTGTNWTWYSSEGRRDHAIVISPKKVLQQTMYELNTLTVKASNNTENGRSTFDDLIDPQHGINVNTFNEFSIEYLNKIQANCLWFQPIHPSGYDRSENDPATPGVRYNPGSPYATRDYFSVNHFFSRAGTEEAAMTEFTNFVSYCDRGTNRLGSTNFIGTVNVMLDGVFNHTSWDAEFGDMGVTLGYCTNKNDRIGWFKPGWFSNWEDYGSPATYYHTAWSNDIATAPDRGDFGKWTDVAELYYGKYSCLVRHNPDNNSDYLNEQDVYDFAGMSQDTIDLWKYIGRYTEYWLQKTGNSLSNRQGQVDAKGIAYDDYGIDGLRCDFGQGLPPQLWEYIINRTRNMKWNFMFMAETLDGGVPGYRSNRHFDILNENMVFQFTQAHVSDPASLRTQLENRRTSYSGGAILLNLTGHDEVMPWSDPWVTASRYAMVSAVMGVPMVFYGQEQGIGPYAGTADKWTGFTNFELNFGKNIPHFKKWNKLRVWDEPPLDAASREMAQWHGRVNWARLHSPALQSPNQYFLGRKTGGDNTKIFAVAKYEAAGAVSNGQDAVLAFALFVNSGDHSGANDTYSLQGCWDLLGLSNSASVFYNVRNLAASDADATLWSPAKSGADLYANGIWVNFPSDTGGNIYDDGAIVQFLKIEEASFPSTATSNSPVAVPYAWLDTYYGSGHTEAEYETLAMQTAANGKLKVWECYAAGLDPTDVNAAFAVESIRSAAGAEVVVASVSNRAYRIEFLDGPLTINPQLWSNFLANGVWINREPFTNRHVFVDTGAATNSGSAVHTQRNYRIWVGLP